MAEITAASNISIFGIIVILLIILAVAGIIALIVAPVTGKKGSSLPSPTGDGSYFDGGTLGLIGWSLLASLLTTITLGIAFPWAMCMLERWKAKHTIINGRRLKFTGTGIGLLGKFLLWGLLTVITLGIFSIWMGLNIEKWKVKHLVYEDDETTYKSEFTAGAGGWFVNCLVKFLLTFFTLGIGYAWAEVRFMKWKAQHTVIGGSSLVFEGTGGQLFVKNLVLFLLSPITLGIYAIFFPVKLLKWEFSNTQALYKTQPIRDLATAHEYEAVRDFAKFKLTANDAELKLVKQGITGNETREQLEALSESSNAYAQYILAVNIKGENDTYDKESAELLRLAAEGGYHPAMLDYAIYIANENTELHIQMLENSAKNGNTIAPWLLKCYYEQMAYNLKTNAADGSLDALKRSAYWFKISLEQENPQALENAHMYNSLIDTIAIWQAQQTKPIASSSAAVIGVIIGAIICLMLILVVAFTIFGFTVPFGEKSDSGPVEIVQLQGEDSMPDYYEDPTPYESVQEQPDSYVIVDRVDGLSESDAFERFVDQGFDVNVNYTDTNDYPDGTVISQSVRYGTELEKGSTITINVAREIVTTEASNDYKMDSRWETAYREGNEIHFNTIIFHSDGTFEEHSCFWENAQITGFQGETGWYVPGMGFPAYFGNYTYDGKTLTLNYTHFDIGELNETKVYSAEGVSQYFIIDGKKYLEGSYTDDEIIAKLSVDTSV